MLEDEENSNSVWWWYVIVGIVVLVFLVLIVFGSISIYNNLIVKKNDTFMGIGSDNKFTFVPPGGKGLYPKGMRIGWLPAPNYDDPKFYS